MRVGILLFFTFSCTSSAIDPMYVAELEAWKNERRASLEEPDGYLSLVGLYWLQKGENTYGSDKENTIHFPENTPESLGSYILDKDTVFHVTSDAKQIVYPSPSEDPIMASHDTYNWYIIKRGEDFAIRLKDSNSMALRNFAPLEYFSVNVDWSTQATFTPFDKPKTLMIENIVGFILPTPSPGQLQFTVQGNDYTLDVLEEGESIFHHFWRQDQRQRHLQCW